MPEKNNTSDRTTLFDRAAALVYLSGIYLVVSITNLIGLKCTLSLGKFTGNILYYLFGFTRKKILHNLVLAYGNKLSKNEMIVLSKEIFRNLGKNWAEHFFCIGPFKKRSLKNISVEGLENLDAALKSGKGVIAVSAHIGCYALIGIKLSMLGYNFVTVISDLKTKAGSIIYNKARKLAQLPAIPTQPEKQFYKDALKLLRENGTLCLISDENQRYGGIFVDFFGRKASTAPGPAGLALRTGAKIIPVFMIRNSDNSQKIIIGEEIKREKTDDPEDDLRNITAGFTIAIENCVRAYPDQWPWMNFRWRTQPEGQSEEARIRHKCLYKKIKRRIRKSF